MFVVITLKSECGSRFEAHVAERGGARAGSWIECPDCGEPLRITGELSEPLVRL